MDNMFPDSGQPSIYLENGVTERPPVEEGIQGRLLELQEENQSLRDTVARQLQELERLATEGNEFSTSQLTDLAAENSELRRLVQQLRERAEQADKNAGATWQSREQEYESLLEEKSEVIRQLHAQVQELQLAKPAAAPGEIPTEDELVELHRELERERDQLKRDEEALMGQVRQMEVQMSKERADIARQRTELQRLHEALKRELEIASRDAALREKLAPLYKLQEEMTARRGGGSGESGVRPRPPLSSGTTPPPIQRAVETKQVRRSGFFRRLFKAD